METKKRILVVEDDAPIAQMVQKRLECAGFAVHIEDTGCGGVQYAEAHHPDLVVLDLRLPDIHGYQVAHDIRARYAPAAVPILMLTALDQPMDKLRGYARGADAYLTKPYRSEELVQVIQRLLEPLTL